MKLFNFHSSSTSFRVRIGLELKGLQYEYAPVTLAWEQGDHDTPEYHRFNPQAIVPVLVDGEVKVTQSLAILDYLDEKYPSPPLFPKDLEGRARVRSLSLYVACEVQPLGNLRIERYLVNRMRHSEDELRAWRRHWIAVGLDAIEAVLSGDASTGEYCFGNAPTVADCVLIPQVYNALRPVVDLDLGTWPTVRRIYETSMANPAFERAHPTRQPDYQELARH